MAKKKKKVYLISEKLFKSQPFFFFFFFHLRYIPKEEKILIVAKTSILASAENLINKLLDVVVTDCGLVLFWISTTANTLSAVENPS